MLLTLYILGICLAINSSQLTRIEQVSCTRYDYTGPVGLPSNKLSTQLNQPSQEDEQLVRLEVIKQKILSQLGMNDIPSIDENTSSKISNDQLFDLLDNEQENAILRSKPNVELLSNSADEPINQAFLFPIKTKDEKSFLFNFTLNPMHNSLGGVDRPKNFILTLRKKSQDKQEKKCSITVEKQSNIDDTENRMNLGNLENLENLDQNTNNIIKYNLNSLMPNSLTTQFLEPMQELFLHFSVMNCQFESAMITIEYETVQNQRSRRSVNCAPGGQTGCCREPLYVNFTTIGWQNWIIHPAGYMANYCHGKCDVSHARFHYTTLSFRFPSIITRCCSPAEMGSISFVYVSKDKNIFKKNLPNMVVERCDCA